MSTKRVTAAVISFISMIVVITLTVDFVSFFLPNPPQTCIVIDLPTYEAQEIEDTGHHDNY